MLTLPKIVERAAQPYFAIKQQVTIPFGETIGKIMPELDAWIAAHKVTTSGAPFFKYNVVKMPELEIEFGFPVAMPVAGDSRAMAGVLPAGRYASLTYWGPYDDLMEVTTMLIGWARQKELRWDARESPNGEIFASRLEIYHTDPMTEPDPQKWETELLFKLAD
jgi:effector-binding domain-containing protein